jgi:hypothetical protein
VRETEEETYYENFELLMTIKISSDMKYGGSLLIRKFDIYLKVRTAL